MKKLVVTIILLSSFISTFSQSRWFSNTDCSLVFPNEMRYLFADENNRSTFVNMPIGTGSMLKGFSLEYSYNYMIFNKLSIGILGGFQAYTAGYDYQFAKLGAVLRYHFVDSDNVFTYVQYSKEISINNATSNGGDDVRLGLEFPVIKKERFNINATIFNEIGLLDLEETSPVLDYYGEQPISMKIKSLGIGVGIRFK